MAVFGKHDIFEFSKLEKEEQKEKNRNWVAVVYPESAPEDWVEQIRALHLPFAISPLHDKDIDITGEPKKAHYHIIVCFDGPTTYKNANRVLQGITNGPIVKPCRSVRGAYRYFIHLDNPEKFQYPETDILTYNSFEIALTDSDEDFIKKAIFSIILVNRIYEYAELMLILEYEFGAEYSKVARRNHSFISSVVNSIRHSPGGTYKRFLNYITPEAFDMYSVSDEYTYENSIEFINDLVTADTKHNEASAASIKAMAKRRREEQE